MFRPHKVILRQLLTDWNYRTFSAGISILYANIEIRRWFRMYAHALLTLPSYYGVHAL
jgi:hypothetical protein